MTRNTDDFQAGSGPVYTGKTGVAPVGGWGTHSISHNGSLTGSEPGMKWDRYTALVPVNTLAKYRDFDRAGSEGFSTSPDTINRIADELRKGGVGAIREPLIISYDHNLKWGYLGEGNHRLAAAIQAGITHLPVQIHTRSSAEQKRRQRRGAFLHMDNRLHEEKTDYWPANVHPGNFLEFEGAR
jgi:hypothetical protein